MLPPPWRPAAPTQRAAAALSGVNRCPVPGAAVVFRDNAGATAGGKGVRHLPFPEEGLKEVTMNARQGTLSGWLSAQRGFCRVSNSTVATARQSTYLQRSLAAFRRRERSAPSDGWERTAPQVYCRSKQRNVGCTQHPLPSPLRGP
uniref:Uncharacterized protein n=1 Tax=Aquila chrysaetos chrysaetos TaxID=223781 RepID=A0A663FHW3_AQUCH